MWLSDWTFLRGALNEVLRDLWCQRFPHITRIVSV